MTTLTTLTTRPTTSDDDLHCQYQGQSSPQPALLCLDCEAGTLEAYASPIIGGGRSMRAHLCRDIEWAIPPLRMAPLARLMDEVAEYCKTILDGWDGSAPHGTLDGIAVQARDAVDAICESWMADATADERWEPWEPSDYYAAHGDDDCQRRELGIDHRTTDAEITTMARDEVAAAEVVLDVDDIERYLTRLRDEAPTVDIIAGGCSEYSEWWDAAGQAIASCHVPGLAAWLDDDSDRLTVSEEEGDDIMAWAMLLPGWDEDDPCIEVD